MNRTSTIRNKDARLLALALTTALAGMALSGCTSSVAPPASVSSAKAEAASAKGKHGSAVTHAEAAVLADPRNAQYRAALGSAYLEAGRYASAAASFDDALKLGETSGRTALSLALALAAQAKYQDAQRVLAAWENAIAPGDFGLAMALAGNPQRGVHVLSNEIRNGGNTPKVRQNLAYAYALGGQWREARLMASQDLTGDKVNQRIAEWAEDASPDAYQMRVARLLGTPFNVTDPGQPVNLALANFPDAVQLAQSTAPIAPVAASAPAAVPAPVPAYAPAPAAQASLELPPIGDPVDASVGPLHREAPRPAALPTKPERAESFGAAFQPVAAPAPAPPPARASAPAAKPAPKTAPATRVTSTATGAKTGTHLVQLGAFSSEASARRAWGIYAKRYPELADHGMVITQAVVNGRNYWRVAASGYSASTARSMCGRINGKGSQGCIAYAQSRPLPGTVNPDRRLASR